jgi:hypothetical protein
MNRWAVVRNGRVENVVVWDGDLVKWQPPEGCEVVADDPDPERPEKGQASPGDTFDGSVFTPAPGPVGPEKSELALIREELAAVRAELEELRAQRGRP